jgi:hypothetical protein
MPYGLLTVPQVSQVSGIKTDTLYRAISSGKLKPLIKDGVKYLDYEKQMPKYCEKSRFFEWNGETVVRTIIHPWSKENRNESSVNPSQPPKQGQLLQRVKTSTGNGFKNSMNDDGIKDAKKAREQEAIYKAKKMRLDYEREAGKVVNVEEIKKQWEDTANLIQQKILSVPERVAPEITGIVMRHLEADTEFEAEHYIRNILREELIYALSGIADGLMEDDFEEPPSPIEIERMKSDEDDVEDDQ